MFMFVVIIDIKSPMYVKCCLKSGTEKVHGFPTTFKSGMVVCYTVP